MAIKNPFFSGSVESIESNSNFLTLLNTSAIEYIKATALDKTAFFRSTPGAGKSSIFRLFTPSVLLELFNSTNPNHADCKQYMSLLGAIGSDKVRVLGIWHSCTHGYKVIDDLYSNGRRKQIFFALLNLRLIRETIQSVAILYGLEPTGYHRITFSYIPAELTSCIEATWTGKELFEWSRNEENQITRSFDDFDTTYPVPFALSSLSVLPLINASNILCDGKTSAEKTLVMLDDIQFLTKMQQEDLREEIFIKKSTVAVWLAERLSQLDNHEILGTTGQPRRDYNEFYVERQLKKLRSLTFLSDIADRRIRSVSEYEASIGSFSACITETLEPSDLQRILTPYLKKLEQELFSNEQNGKLFLYYSQNYSEDLLSAAIFLRSVKILIARYINKLKNQTTFLSLAQVRINEIVNNHGKLTKKFKDLLGPAEVYLCAETGLPYFYGKERIQKLYTYNIEQYLDIAGEIFESRIANNYSSSRKHNKQVTAKEQETIIIALARKKWEQIQREYTNYEDIYNLLNNIIKFGVDSREKGLAAYSGGAYTGIGIPTLMLNEILDTGAHLPIVAALANAVTSNHVFINEQKHGAPNERWTVFYLNRWICVLHSLPLAYGGWKEVNADVFSRLIDKTIPDSVVGEDEYYNISLSE